jgi:NADH:ubiquinone oxidoreductase subunit F (NADH-binding)
MEEGSICGLGMVAHKPLVDAMKYFPEAFGRR